MYQISRNGNLIVRLSDRAFIPMDPDNNDYTAYLEWVAAGNVAETEAPTREDLNAPILAQIDAIEAGQARAVREALIGLPGAVDRLTALNDQITALRARLI